MENKPKLFLYLGSRSPRLQQYLGVIVTRRPILLFSIPKLIACHAQEEVILEMRIGGKIRFDPADLVDPGLILPLGLSFFDTVVVRIYAIIR